MIYTVTLNPAIDRTIILKQLNRGKVNRVLKSRVDIGGKGINVSKVLRSLKAMSICTGILGNKNSNDFIDYLENLGIKNDFCIVPGENRTNLKIVEKNKDIVTDINDKGFKTNIDQFNKFLSRLLSLVREHDIVVLSGSVPEGLDKNVYRYMIEKLKKNKVKTILDADKEILYNGIQAAPFAVKPNVDELNYVLKIDENDMSSIIGGAKYLLKIGIEKVLISLGKRGSLFVSNSNILYSEGLEVPVKSTVGAGDSMVAGLAYGIMKGFDDLKTLRLSTACSTAKVMTEGTDMLDKKLIVKLLKRVNIKTF